MIVIFDLDTRTVLGVTDGKRVWRLEGECLRCGNCCRRKGCDALIDEMVDNKPRARCEAQWSKPYQCMLWPNDPTDEKQIPEECGYRWVEQ